MRLETARRALIGQNHIAQPILQNSALDLGMDREGIAAPPGHDAGTGRIVQAGTGIQQVERGDVVADAGMLGRRRGRPAEGRGGLGLGRVGRTEEGREGEGLLGGGGGGAVLVVVGAAVAAHEAAAGGRFSRDAGGGRRRRGSSSSRR